MTDPDILLRVFIDDDRLRSLPKAFAQRAVRSLDHRR